MRSWISERAMGLSRPTPPIWHWSREAAQNIARMQPGVSGGFMMGRGRNPANAPPAPKPADATATSGAVAVHESKRARAQQDVIRVETDGASSAMRTAGGKTFYLRDGVWTDADFKEGSKMPETAVKFGTEEYFTLLKQKPKLAAFFSLGERVVVILDGTVYRVNAGN